MNVAVVTGGAKGIGLAIVRRLAQDGWQVVAAGRDREALDAVVGDITAGGYEVTGIRCDVTDDQSVADAISACDRLYGCPDLLVNNAGTAGATVATTALELSDWNQVLAVNLTGAMLCCRAVLPGMLDRGSGHIVNISSITGKRPLSYRAAYAASKLGLIGLTRSLAEEVGPARVRVNAISPGPVYGERIERVLEGQAAARNVQIEQARAEFTSSAPLRRFVQAAEVAEAVVALHGMTAVTGVDLNVAAGLVMY